MYGGEVVCDRSLPEALIVRSLAEAFECSPDSIYLGANDREKEAPQAVYCVPSVVDGEYKLRLQMQYREHSMPFEQRALRFCYTARCHGLIRDDRELKQHTRVLVNPPCELLHVTLDEQAYATASFDINPEGLIHYGSFAVDHWLGNVAIHAGLSKALPFDWQQITLRNVVNRGQPLPKTALLVDVEAHTHPDFPLRIDVWCRSGSPWSPQTIAAHQWVATVERFCAIQQCAAQVSHVGLAAPQIIGAATKA